MRVALVAAIMLAAAGCGRGNTAPEGKATRAGAVGEFKGDWRVTGLRVGSGDVQALVDDDPAYVGAKLTIADEALSWDAAGKDGTLDERCEDPVIDAPVTAATFLAEPPADLPGLEQGQLFLVGCARPSSSRAWAFIKLADGRLVMPWYDNAFLILERA